MKQELLYLSPLPPANSGIALFSALILNQLSETFDIKVYMQNSGDVALSSINFSGGINDLKSFPLDDTDNGSLILYQIGSNKIHTGIYLAALLRPGIVMLHEYVLHHLVKAVTIGSGDREVYTAELAKYYGAEGEEIARLVHTGRAASETLYFHYPLYQRIVERSRAVITTTLFSKKIISAAYPSKPVYYVPICRNYRDEIPSKRDARAALGLKDEFLVGVFGHISEAKEVGLLLDVVSSLKKSIPRIRLVLAGAAHKDLNLMNEIEKRKLGEFVIPTGYLENDIYFNWLGSCDLCISLRYPSGGESSGSLLDLMGAGKAVIISDYAQYREIDGKTVIQIPAGRDKKEILAKVLEYYSTNIEKLEQIGTRARENVLKNYEPENSVQELCRVLHSIADSDKRDVEPLTETERKRFEKLYKYFVIDDRPVIEEKYIVDIKRRSLW